MEGYLKNEKKKITARHLIDMKQAGERISMLTSYDFTMAQIVDAAGVDAVLIGDSASNVMAGNATTIPITVDEMIVYARSVARAVRHALVIVDMPFGSYQARPGDAVANAIHIIKETGADAVKLEGGEEYVGVIRRIIDAGIPVMGHLGLMPQSINKYGTYGVRAKGEAEAEKLIRDAHLLEETGCFGIVLEKIPAELAGRVTSELSIPIIGIGAGNKCDGQVLVIHDMLGMTTGFSPKFLRKYADLHTVISEAVSRYTADVKSGDFPNDHEQY